jgi:arginine decarboxylase
MDALIPSRIFLTGGVGRHKEKLASFELALREAGISPFNLVKISSIYPPNCRLITRPEGLALLKPGQVLHLVLSECATDEAHRRIAAAIGIARPNTPEHYGYLAEYHSFGQVEEEAGHHAEDLAAFMLATILGHDFDLREIWEQKKSVYRISKDVTVTTQNLTAAAQGEAGTWTTAVAAAVCIP